MMDYDSRIPITSWKCRYFTVSFQSVTAFVKSVCNISAILKDQLTGVALLQRRFQPLRMFVSHKAKCGVFPSKNGSCFNISKSERCYTTDRALIRMWNENKTFVCFVL